ncbi:hypothetical protein [Amycolatopsis sp. NPDC004079]|uniref:hypothetical protein n=1 Tax=Amycolatopsis sp. NPDC004079 TaxID=3154549 RepID=UPI0033AD0C51
MTTNNTPPPLRTTHTLTTIAHAILTNPTAHHWGYNLHQHTGIPTITIQKTLHRLTQHGHLTATWEHPHKAKTRPPRHYHQPTPTGITWLTQLLTTAKPHHQPTPTTGPPPGTHNP